MMMGWNSSRWKRRGYNLVIKAEEAEAEQRARLAAEQPSEDGFITVTHGSAPSFGAMNDLEAESHHQREGGKDDSTSNEPDFHVAFDEKVSINDPLHPHPADTTILQKIPYSYKRSEGKDRMGGGRATEDAEDCTAGTRAGFDGRIRGAQDVTSLGREQKRGERSADKYILEYE